MRNRLDEQLELLNTELIRMGALCEDGISQAAQVLVTRDEALRRAVDETEQEIDRKEREIEAICLRLLLQQQPVAKDLRLISAAMKMIADMERIGDQASDIAEMVEHIRAEVLPGSLHIAEMARAAVKMVTNSVDSFVRRDIDIARAVEKADDEVDALFNKVKSEIIALIAEKPEEGETCLDLLKQHENLLILHTFSKAYSLAGVRLGYLLGSEAVIREFIKFRQPYSVDAVSQAIAKVVYAHRNEFLENARELAQAAQDLAAVLGEMPQVQAVYPTDANFVLFKVARADLVWQMLYDQGVLVRDFSRCPGIEGCLRVTAGTPDENRKFLDALANALRAR